MGGHHIGDIRLACLQSVYLHPGTVHIHRRDLIPQTLKYPAGLLIGRVFHGNGPPRPKDLVQEHQKILVPCADDDLLRPAVDAPGRVEIPSYGLPKGRLPLRRACEKHLLIVLNQGVFCNFSPRIVGEVGQINASWREINNRLPLLPLFFPDKSSGKLYFHLHHLLHPQHKVPSVGNRIHIPLCYQLVISHLGGGTADLQILCQNPGRGEPRPLRQAASADLFLHILIDLLIQGRSVRS